MPGLSTLHAKALVIGGVGLCLWLAGRSVVAEEGVYMRLISEEALAVVTIMQEAAGESYQGKLAVAEVIRNRMQKKYASDGTVSGTVLRPKQFSGWNTADPGRIRNIRIDSEDKVVKECIAAWYEAQSGSNITRDAVLYYNPTIITEPPDWALPDSATQVAVIGQHHFFVPKPRPGTVKV